jgi:hypothetical protein
MELRKNGKIESLAYLAFVLSLFYGLFVKHTDVIIVSGVGLCLTIGHSYNRLERKLRRRFRQTEDERIIRRIARRVLRGLNLDDRDGPKHPPKQYVQ